MIENVDHEEDLFKEEEVMDQLLKIGLVTEEEFNMEQLDYQAPNKDTLGCMVRCSTTILHTEFPTLWSGPQMPISFSS